MPADLWLRIPCSSGVPAMLRPEMKLVQSLMLSASGFVLLVVCLNVVGMVLVRSATRERELALRLAIGSSCGRLVRTQMAESLLLALASGFVAVTGVFGSLAFLSWRLNQPIPESLRADLGIFAICFAFSLAVTMAIGLWPALRFSRPGLFVALRGEAGSGGRRAGRVHRIAAAAQAGLALPFLVIGVIYLDHARSRAHGRLRPRFRTRGAPRDAAGPHRRRSHVAGGGRLPAERPGERARDGGGDRGEPRRRAPARPGATPRAGRAGGRSRPGAGPDDARLRRLLATLGAPLLAGRDVSVEDGPGSVPVAIVTQALASRLWPGGDALGERLKLALDGNEEAELRVVGVAADVAGARVYDEREAVFVPLAQHPTERVWVVLRAAADPATMASALQEIAAERDPDLLRPEVVTGELLVDDTVGDYVVSAVVSGMFSVVALLLAALGVYGIVAFMVSARSREFGVRMAVGASRPRVVREVFRDSVKLVLPGLAGGTLLVAAFLRVKTDIPQATTAGYAAAFVVGVAVALAIVILASLGPALGAAGVDPAEAMRTD